MKDHIATDIIPSLPVNVAGKTRAEGGNPNIAILSYSEESVNIHSFYNANDVGELQNQISNIPQSEKGTSITKGASIANQLLSVGSEKNMMMIMGSGKQADLDNAIGLMNNMGNLASSIALVALGEASKLDLSNITTVTPYTSSNYYLDQNATNALVGQLNPSGVT